MKFIDVYVTCSDRQTAARIARVCVDERLAACANIGEAIESIYRWKGQIEEALEFPLLLKTRAELFGKLAARVKAEHPYETPCIIASELVAIDPGYAAWLEAETT
ncbi:MAG TPA: divalent-cation tolerance protein CutA [Hyphomonadaceae bacterium]|jgi:periplasmic divalent cation tolerance protein|nr:divalent-cation tolerance protein CutA [Hyphomonadaceae bacterium]